MKLISVLYFTLTSFALWAQLPAMIDYADISTFDWQLFQGKINKDHIAEMGHNTGAVTVSSISYTTQQTSATAASIIITSRFHTQESWTRFPALNNPDEALKHERRHMEITEIYARKLRKAAVEARFTSRNFKAEVDRLFSDLTKQHRAEQVKYDHETKHSLVQDQQVKWDKKIDALLKELSAYSNPSLKVALH